MKIKRGSTSVRRLIFIADSASTVGAGLANLVHNSSGLVAWYFAGDLSNDVQITLATATLGTWTSGGFVAVDNTNMPGWYEIGIPNAALDGGNECSIQLRGAANMVPVNVYIELDAFDYQTATQPVNVIQFGGTNGTFAAGIPTAALDSAATTALVDLIWDEPLTGATHNVATSSGKRLRQATAFQQIDSTVIDASATTTTFATGLDSAVDNFYNDSMLVFTDGALAGQVRSIVDYVGATKTIILEEALTSAPVNGVAFTIVSLHIHPVSQIQSGLATASALAAAKTILDKVDTGLVVDGAVYQFTANMLELGPSGGGGSSVNVLPATGIVADRSAGVTLTPVVGETISQSITMYRTDGTTAVNVSGKTLAIVFETLSGVDVATVASGNITISGASSNIVTFAYPSAVTASERTLRFAIRDAAAPLTMYLQGVCSVVAAPKVDA